MKERQHPLGDKNVIGAKITLLRQKQGMKQKDLLAKLQVEGVEINASSLSKLEGQTRSVTDKEIIAFTRIFNVSVEALLLEEFDI